MFTLYSELSFMFILSNDKSLSHLQIISPFSYTTEIVGWIIYFLSVKNLTFLWQVIPKRIELKIDNNRK